MRVSSFLCSKWPAVTKLVGMVLILCLATTIGLGQQKQEPAQPYNTVQYKVEAWKEYKPAGGRFSMLLPGVPVEHVEALDATGGKGSIHMFFLAVLYKETYAICFSSYNDTLGEVTDKAALRRALDSGRDELLTSKSTRRLISETDVYLDSYLGREITFQDGDVEMIQRLFLVKDRLYQVAVGFPIKSTPSPDVKGFQDELRQKIFRSFKVLPIE